MTAAALSLGRIGDRRWLAGVPILFLVVFSSLPVVIFLSRALADPEPTLEHLKALFSTDLYFLQLWNTIRIAAVVTALSILLGYPLASLAATAAPRKRSLILALVVLPFWTSVLVRSFAWILVLSDVGVLNKSLIWIGAISDSIPIMGSATATLIGMVYVMLPYAVLIIYTALSRIDSTLPRAAGTMGARPWQEFVHVILPLSMPGILSASLLIFIESLGFYITPSLLGGAGSTMIAQSIEQQVSLLLNWGMAATLALLLLVSSVIVYALYIRVAGIDGLWDAFAGGAGRRKAITGETDEKLRTPAVGNVLDRMSISFSSRFGSGIAMMRVLPFTMRAIGWLMLVYLLLPLVVIVVASFSSAGYLTFPPPGFSLRWYEEVFHSQSWMAGLKNSLTVGIGSAFLSAVLGVMAAFGLLSLGTGARARLTLLFLSPLLLPRILIAVGSVYFFARFGLAGTPIALTVIHATLGLPLVLISVATVLASFDTRLPQAASTLGASPFRAFWHVSLPIIAPGVVAGSLFAFITSFDDLVIALFMTNGSFQTLPKVMWDDIQLNVRPTLAAIATMLMLLSAFIVILSGAVRKRAA